MKIVTDITRQDYFEFNRYHFLQTRLTDSVLMGILILFVLQLLLNWESFKFTTTIVSTIVFVIIYGISIISSLNKTKYIPENNGAILGVKEFEFTENSIFYKTNNSQGTYQWTSIKHLKESPKAFYLYADANLAMLVPKRTFKDTAELEDFRNLITRKTNTA